MCEQAAAWPSDLLQLHPDSSLFCPGAALTEITQLLPCTEGRGVLSVPKSSWVVDLLPLSLMVCSCCGQDAGVFPQTIFPLLWLKLQGVHPKSGVYLLFFYYFFFSLLAISGCQTRGWRRKELNEIIVHCSALTLVGLEQCLGLPQGWDFHCSSTPACPPELNLQEPCPQSTPGYFSYLGQHKLVSASSNWDSVFSGQSRSDPFFSCSLKEENENTSFSVVRHKM